MTADSELLRCFVENRSEPAFAELVQRHLNLVYGTARRRANGDSHLAEEVTQEVFTRLAREADNLQKHPVLNGWLYVATRHAAANAMRTERRRKIHEEKAHAMQHDETPRPVENWSQLRPELDAVLDELNDRERDVVLLRFFEGQPFGAIGTALRISEDAARMRLERALDKLRQILAQRGITSTAAALGAALASQTGIAAPAGLAAGVTTAALMGAGASGTGAIGILTFMSTTKVVAGIAVAIALAGVIGFVIEHKANVQLQQEVAAMRVQTPRAKVRQTDRPSIANSAEIENLRAENAELKRVRDELTARATRAAQGSAREKVPDGMMPVGAWKNAGTGTPDAALGTMLWAATSGDVDALASVISLEPAAWEKANTLFAGLPEASRAQYGSADKLIALLAAEATPTITAIQVTGSKKSGDDDMEEVTLRIATVQGTDKAFRMRLRDQPGGWRVSIPVGLVELWMRKITDAPTAPVAADGNR
jgi:RNA polymerase sigma factor (sigma-70 family)